MAIIERYLAPTTIEEAVRTLKEADVSMFAGGTDLIVQMQTQAHTTQPVLMNIARIASLRGIEEINGQIRIGALTTITDILESSLLSDIAPVLVDAADHFASSQVRNSATIGGNICNASPAGDMIIPLLLLEAEVELAYQKGDEVVRECLPLDGFFTGPGTTQLRSDQILVSIHFDIPNSTSAAAFKKFATRPAMDISIASIGIAGTMRQGKLDDAVVAFGAVAPIPMRGRATEAALEGTVLDDEAIAHIATVAGDEIKPISDVRAGAWYRRQIVREMTRRLLHDLRN